MLGTWELVAIFLLILLIFGGKKIPEVARGLGKAMREFKNAKNDITDSLNASIDNEDQAAPATKDVAKDQKAEEEMSKSS